MSEKIEQFVGIIKQLIPVSDLSPGAQNDAVRVAELLEFKKKKFVFKEGDRDVYSYYVLEGKLELIANKSVQSVIVGGTENARYALSQLQPRQFSAKAKTPVVILRLDRGVLDRLMVHEGNKDVDITNTGVEMGVSHIEEEDSSDWMTKMLQSELFARLPMANIQQLFTYLEATEFNKGDTVIKQGEPGENYYIIEEGVCEVTRIPKKGGSPVKLGELSMGDSFGEEALLTDSTRNSTITMLTDGILMQLSKENFAELIKKPSLISISFDKAQEIIDGGGVWVDVRFAKEYEISNIETSINIPLNILRTQLDKFNTETQYILYCDTGGRSSAAAFLLTQAGIYVSYLEGGLVSNPHAANDQDQDDQTITSFTRKGTPKESPKKAVETKIVKENAEQTIDDITNIAVRTSILETDLARKKMELEAAKKKQKEESKRINKKQKEAHEAERKKLEQEKTEIERQKKLAEDEVEKKRKEEQEKIERSKKNAESRMREEKEKLEEVYSKNTEEMKKLQEMKTSAEEQIREIKEQFEKQVKESRRELDETKGLKDSVHEEKKKIEEEAEQQRAKQAELEKRVEAKAKALLESEKRKLAEKVAQNNEELERAKREKAAAEAGRVAAKEEADRIIEEYKAHFEQEKTELESSLKAERTKLENEAQQIKDKLDEIRKIKDAAKAARKSAAKHADKLKAKYAKKGEGNDSLKQKMQRAEEKLKEAKRALDDAQHEEKIAEAAKEENKEDLLRQKEKEEKLERKIAAELYDWKEEDRREQFKKKVFQAEHIKRIKKRAEIARGKMREAAD